MAEEIPADFGQTHPSHVPAMGGNGWVIGVVLFEDSVLTRSA